MEEVILKKKTRSACLWKLMLLYNNNLAFSRKKTFALIETFDREQ